jgi:hypothetical protein
LTCFGLWNKRRLRHKKLKLVRGHRHARDRDLAAWLEHQGRPVLEDDADAYIVTFSLPRKPSASGYVTVERAQSSVETPNATRAS